MHQANALALILVFGCCFAKLYSQDQFVESAKAVVFVRTDEGQGTGFLIQRWGNYGLVATNAHVVAGNRSVVKNLTLVFHSGSDDEFSEPAILLAYDPLEDIALLGVKAKELPRPLELSDKTAALTQTVRIAGFPFGSMLARHKANPGLTVGFATVSAVHKDKIDVVDELQLDGSINPGNSGGPIFDESGKVMGIVTAKLNNTSIGFVKPIRKLVDRLGGIPICCGIWKGGDSASSRIRGLVFDPYHQIVRVQAHLINVAELEKLEPNLRTKKSWPKLEADASVLLERSGAYVEAECPPQFAFQETPIPIQFSFQRKDGSKLYSPPVPLLPLESSGQLSSSVQEQMRLISWPNWKDNPIGSTEWDDVLQRMKTDTPDVCTASAKLIAAGSIASPSTKVGPLTVRKLSVPLNDVAPRIFWSANGNRLFWYRDSGEIFSVEYPSAKNLTRTDLSIHINDLALCGNSLAVYTRTRQALIKLDLIHAKIENTIGQIPDGYSLLGSSKSNTLFLQQNAQKNQLLKVDMTKPEGVTQYAFPDQPEPAIALQLPDHGTAFFMGGSSITEFRATGAGLVVSAKHQYPEGSTVTAFTDSVGKQLVGSARLQDGGHSIVVHKSREGEQHDESVALDSPLQHLAMPSTKPPLIAITDQNRAYCAQNNFQFVPCRFPGGTHQVLAIACNPMHTVTAVMTNQGIYWIE